MVRITRRQRPHLITFYFPEVDHAGHSFWTRFQETKEAVHFIDQSIKKLNDEVAKQDLMSILFLYPIMV
nr:alkaline phosphatase family protein [Algoriella xinjiangensis]